MFIRFDTKLYRQIIGIPMGLNLCSQGCRFIFVVLFYDFINLTQVHNFTDNAQDISTICRLPLFTVSFTEIKQILMQIMKRFVSSY